MPTISGDDTAINQPRNERSNPNPLILDNNGDDEPSINHSSNNEDTSDLDEHIPPPQPIPHCSSHITIPMEKNPNGGLAITKTAAAVQQSLESMA